MARLPKSQFISHGGGPLPLLGDPQHCEMVACLQIIARSIPRPDAIVVISAHWEAKIPTIACSATPALIYDYSGFPPESYATQYPRVGEPPLAGEVNWGLDRSNIDFGLDETRGFDRGGFAPLKIMSPEADIPCIQLSLVETLDPSQQLTSVRLSGGNTSRTSWCSVQASRFII